MLKNMEFINSIDFFIFHNCTEKEVFDTSFSSFFEENFSSQLFNFSEGYSLKLLNPQKPEKCLDSLRNDFFGKIGEKLSILIGQFSENFLQNSLNNSKKTLLKFLNRNCPVDIKLHSNLLIKKLAFYLAKFSKIDEKTKIQLSFYLNFTRKWENSYYQILDIKKKKKPALKKNFFTFPNLVNFHNFIYLQENFQKKNFQNLTGDYGENKSKKSFLNSKLLKNYSFCNNFDLFIFFLWSETKFSFNKNIIFLMLRNSFFMSNSNLLGKETISFFEKKIRFKINHVFFFQEIKPKKFDFFSNKTFNNYFFFTEDFFKLKAIKIMDKLALKMTIKKKVTKII